MNRRLPKIAAVVSMLFALNARSAVQLVPSATTVNVNEVFTVSVQASGLANIDSASVTFAYDQNRARLDAVTLDGGSAFCDLVVRDADVNDGLVDGIFALAHMSGGDPCPAVNGDFVAFRFEMTALAEGNASLVMTQDATGFGWTSEDNPGVTVDADTTTASPVQIAIVALSDFDGDGVFDSQDNCINVSNTDQRDTDSDNFGNACDPDLNNDYVVNSADLGMLKDVFFTNDSDADLNGDGAVNSGDLSILKSFFFLPPGPSGVAP